MPAGVTHQLVRQYLLHFGYADTLRAFDSAAGVLPDDEAVLADRWVRSILPNSCCRSTDAVLPVAAGTQTMVLAARLSWCSSCDVACAVATAAAGVLHTCQAS